ncbi:MAG: hypothetical protein AAGC55_03870, partial [Myxococcota bacterium]
AAAMIPSLRGQPFRNYFNWFMNEQVSGSCGATSGWLDRITSRQHDQGVGSLTTEKATSFLNKIMYAMISNGGRWYCRCTLDVHSFFIECIGRKAAVYQSYFGKYPLVKSIANLREMNRMEFMPLLEAAVHDDMTLTCLKLGTDTDWNDLSDKQLRSWEKKYRSGLNITRGQRLSSMEQVVYQGRRRIFLNAAPLHQSDTVQYRINANPAATGAIKTAIRQSVRQYKLQWNALLGSSKTLQQVMDEFRA